MEDAPQVAPAAGDGASAPSKKQQQKKERAAAAALAGTLADELAAAASGVDQALSGTAAQRAWAKQKRKELRQLTTTVADPATPLEERLRLLQRALAAEVEGRVAAEQRALAADAKSAGARQAAEGDAARARQLAAEQGELSRKLEQLARSQAEQLRLSGARGDAADAQLAAYKDLIGVSIYILYTCI
ncbi:MAG: hypothetical protein J3K34DRAFT_45809 [Monoraphidium minutum]|nr:MAG: hypothetical protein J3K34DRAFT_45809 [Monoraphidium minutum]